VCVVDFAVDGEGGSISAFICQEVVNFTGGEISCLGFINKGCQSVVLFCFLR